MIIRKAKLSEYPDVRAFYHSLIDAMQGSTYHPKWQKDIYPAPEDLQAAIDAQTLYIGLVKDQIAAAMVVNCESNDGYQQAHWTSDLKPGEFAVIHMLGVHSDYARQGYAKEMVRHALAAAEQAGLKAIRLDVLEGNIPAERLYEEFGFRFVDTVLLYYEDTGRVRFKLYEREIGDGSLSPFPKKRVLHII